ncbi:hypothetical protein RIF29_31217 [Crotalaria pallida]|uniref:START domain-containing protein n=1 Tax=Crotalaria pallida TaxID=3830 RepID=A0AAN9EHL3_CROPI
MDGGVVKENATQGTEGSDQTLSGNEARHPINNCVEEGSSSPIAPPGFEKMMQESPKIQMDDAENSKAPSANPGFYIERASDFIIVMVASLEESRIEICNFALSAFNKLLKIANAGEPLWKPLKGHEFQVMDKIEYLKVYGSELEKYKEVLNNQAESPEIPTPAKKKIPREHVKVEGSRAVEVIKMSSIDLVSLFMDVNQWSTTFSNIVSRAAFLGIMANGVEGGYDGRVQVMSAELQLPTPLVATWEFAFGRYSKKVASDTWLITDFPMDKFIDPSEKVFQRKVSGCLIQEMPNGYSKVTWVERMIADGSKLMNIHQFQPFVYSGLAFGATPWLASLVRSIEFSETLKAENTLTDHGTKLPEEGRAGFLNLAGSMMRTFHADISGTSSKRWLKITNPFGGSLDMRVRVKSIKQDIGKPEVATLFFATSIQVLGSPLQLFDFFRAENTIQKKTILDEDQSEVDTYYLQESCMYSSGSYYVVYSPVEKHALSKILNGGDPNKVVIEPSGFVFLPDGVTLDDGDGSEGGASSTILTIAFVIQSATGTNHIVSPESVAFSYQYVNHMRQAIDAAFSQK